MTPETFESLLVDFITDLDMPARPYPEDPGNYFPEHDPGEVLVRFEGRKPVERDLAGQHSKVTFFAEIVVATRQVRGTDGAYDWLQRIYENLESYTLTGMTGQLKLEVESFMDQKDDLWQFGQKWAVTTDEYQTYTGDYEQHDLGTE